MIWLTWRQHRIAILAAAAIAVLLVAALAMLGSQTARSSRLVDVYQAIRTQWNVMWFLLLLLPLVAGIFLGAPLLASDFERGTHRLLWTQGVTRMRWLVGKLAVAMTAILVGAAIVDVAAQLAIPTQWSTAAAWTYANQWLFFDQGGLTLPAYVLFAVSLGVAAGALVGRSLLAMVITGIVYAVWRAVVGTFIRPNYFQPLEARPAVQPANWVTSVQGNLNGGPITLYYQPADRFWTFQGIEATMFVGLSVLLLTLTTFVVLRRDA
jgi:ABC-type transport system involved in multi-copper enzyme maturation permease subunit